jgi:flavin-dependent dehydrogenase
MNRSIEIVGGGLAGLSLGLLLREAGVPVTVFEAGRYPRHRVCGEFLAGLDEATIARLALVPLLASAARHDSVAWFFRDRLIARQILPAPVFALSRLCLDAALARRLQAAGGILVTGQRFTDAARPGLVFAHGRRPAASPWLGLKCHVRGLALASGLEMHLGRGAYVGLCEVEDGWINVCGLFRRNAVKSPRDGILLAHLRAAGLATLADRIGRAEVRPGSATAVAGLGFGATWVSDDHMRIGDAGAMIPPFTGNGMTMALTSAVVAAEPLVQWAQDALAWPDAVRAVRDRLGALFRTRLASAAALHPLLLRPLGQRCTAVALRTGAVPFQRVFSLLH